MQLQVLGPPRHLAPVLAGRSSHTRPRHTGTSALGEACGRGGDGGRMPGAQRHHSQAPGWPRSGAGGAWEGPTRVLWPGLGKRQMPRSFPSPLFQSYQFLGSWPSCPAPFRGGQPKMDSCHGYSRLGWRIRFPARRLGQLICISGRSRPHPQHLPPGLALPSPSCDRLGALTGSIALLAITSTAAGRGRRGRPASPPGHEGRKGGPGPRASSARWGPEPCPAPALSSGG